MERNQNTVSILIQEKLQQYISRAPDRDLPESIYIYIRK